jgi:hypothetical protein
VVDRLERVKPKDELGQDDDAAVKRLVSLLSEAVSNLTSHVQSPHRFRFVSAAQAIPHTTALAFWVKGGEVGPPPEATVGEVRAAIYSQSESASELKAFAKVASVAAAELRRRQSRD